MDLQLLTQTLSEHGEPSFRARQVWAWAARGAQGFQEMTDLPAPLRDALERELPFSSLRVRAERHAGDGTLMALFETSDGRPLEAVLLQYRDGRRSLCVSSQSGCPLTCAFFATGWIPGIERLAEQDMPLRLALSLHAAEEALRSELMAVNERFPLSDVIEACRAFYARRRRRVFVEYVMLAGVNDRYEQALALARLLAPRRPARALPGRRPDQPARETQMFKVNLIPYNPTGASGPDPFRCSSRESIAAFRAALEAHGVEATVRLTRGRDIDAACGQLAARAIA